MTLSSSTKPLNWFYLVPFILWCIAGGLLLYTYNASSLFFWVNAHNSAWADTLFEWCSHMGEFWGILTISVLLILLFRVFRDIWFVVAVLAGTIIPSLVTQWIKHMVGAPRPMKLFGHITHLHRLDSWDLLHNNSFPSGHTTGAFSFFLIVSLWLPRRYHPLGLVAFFMALSTAYARVYLTAHFFADIYAGSIIGTCCALLLFPLIMWCRRYFADKPRF